MRTVVIVRVILFALLVVPSHPARGRNPDRTIGMIKKPLSTWPVIRQIGEPFEIECAIETGTPDFRARLVLPGEFRIEIELPIDSVQDPGGETWLIQTRVPEGTPEECYDLRVDSPGGSDTSRAAVKVVLSYPDEFYFVHISDDHVGVFPGNDGSMLRELIDGFHIIHPEFVVDTGDCTEFGLESEFVQFVDIVETMRLPSFIVQGNHDVDHVECALRIGEAREEHRRMMHERWERYVGPRNFSFDFGQLHGALVEISGYENIDPEIWPNVCPYQDLEPEQVDWLQQDMQDHQGSILRMVGAHQSEDDNQNLDDICDAEGVSLFLSGHHHDDHVELRGSTPTMEVRTAPSQAGHYRLVRVSGPEIVSVAYGDDPVSSIPGGGALTLRYSPANNGSSREVTAVVANGLDERFERSRLRFLVPAAGGSYVVEGASVFQSFNAGSTTAIYVRADVLPTAITVVDVRSTDSQAIQIEPRSGPESGGNTVVVHGQGFDAAAGARVVFGLRPAVVLDVAEDTITVEAPAGSGVVNVAVQSGGPGHLLVDAYSYVPLPRLMFLDPSSGPEEGGNLVTIVGEGFTDPPDTLVTFGDAPASVEDVSEYQTTVVAPPGTGVVDVTLANRYGSDTLELAYEYISFPDAGQDGSEDDGQDGSDADTDGSASGDHAGDAGDDGPRPAGGCSCATPLTAQGFGPSMLMLIALLVLALNPRAWPGCSRR